VITVHVVTEFATIDVVKQNYSITNYTVTNYW